MPNRGKVSPFIFCYVSCYCLYVCNNVSSFFSSPLNFSISRFFVITYIFICLFLFLCSLCLCCLPHLCYILGESIIRYVIRDYTWLHDNAIQFCLGQELHANQEIVRVSLRVSQMASPFVTSVRNSFACLYCSHSPLVPCFCRVRPVPSVVPSFLPCFK